MISFLSQIPYAQPDPIFELTAEYNRDGSTKKVNLGQGAYRDENGMPWVLKSVIQAKRAIEGSGHEYLPILGLEDFRKGCTKLLFGEESPIVLENRVGSSQSISGTGSLHLVAIFLANYYSTTHKVFIPDPTWNNHRAIFEGAGFDVQLYSYFDSHHMALYFERLQEDLLRCPEGSIVVLHACAHNPTGIDPSFEQWKKIGKIVKDKHLFPIFDAAYLGFNSGSIDTDCWAIRYFFHDLNLTGAVCMSFSKNMGLYGERVGCVQIITNTFDEAKNVESILSKLQRSEVSNPPAYGARLATAIFSSKEYMQQWKIDLRTMSCRINTMRKLLVDNLRKHNAPGSWVHVIDQNGMFGFLGLTETEVKDLRLDHHIYMAANSRISIAGLNEANVEYVAQCITSVVSKR
ncbi:LADA_0D13256g1_1 [Lachancea dasiensis]|uniref:Aspartate aminotransferase n=1 Tax=Lachancea dasiensis TaxID=1072105 RepID=A0A1G4J8G5_9SACH|nr:LADA_0D13256g1_1 [Lachancea dasiensis]